MITQPKILAMPSVKGVYPVDIQKSAIATIADSAANNPTTKQAVLVGAGIVTVDNVKQAYVGQYAMTPAQLGSTKLKPGMDKAVQRNIDNGMPIEKAIPPTAWKSGDIKSFNKTEQTIVQSTMIDNGAKTLETVVPGSIKSPIESVGIATAISQTGISPSQLKSSPTSLIKSILPSGISAKSLIGSLSKTSLGQLGIAGSAIGSTLNGLKSNLQFGLDKPQSLSMKSLSVDNLKSAVTSQLNGLKSAASAKISGAIGAVTAKANGIMNSLNALKDKASGLASSIASGFSKANSNNLADMSAEIKNKTGSISAGGDYRVPRLK